MKNTVHLSVFKAAFDVMWTDEKKNEYRKDSKRNISLFYKKDKTKKNIKYAKIINGYGSHRPYIVAKVKDFHRARKRYTMRYSNGLFVQIEKGVINIELGSIIEKGNIVNQTSYRITP